MSLSSAANPTREPVPDTRKAFQAGVMALDRNYKYLKYSMEYILIILSLSQLLTAPLHLLTTHLPILSQQQPHPPTSTTTKTNKQPVRQKQNKNHDAPASRIRACLGMWSILDLNHCC